MAIYRFGGEVLCLVGCVGFGRRVARSSRSKEGAMLADRLLKGIWKKLAVV